MMNSADDATKSLEDHKKWLDETLSGYDAVKSAADKAFSAANKAPEGVVQSDLKASLEEQAKAAEALQNRINANKAALTETATLLREFQNIGKAGGEGTTGLDPIIAQIEHLIGLRVSTNSTRAELDDATVSARQLFNTAKDPAIKEMAGGVYDLANQLRDAKAMAESTAAALAAMGRLSPISIAVDVALTGYDEAMKNLKALAPDLRTQREKAQDELNAALTRAEVVPGAGAGMRTAAYDQYSKTIAAQDAQDAQQAAERAAKASARAAKQVSEYDQAIQAIRERTSAQELETNVIGLSTYAAEKARKQLELENAAKKDAIGLSPSRIKQIDEEASAYARVQAANEKATEAEQARDEARQFAQGNFRSFFVELGSLTDDGELSWDDWAKAGTNALDRIRDRALGMAADGIFDLLFNSVSSAFSGGGGGGIGSFFSNIFGIGKNAKGTDNWRGGPTWINEEGGEIVDLPNGTRIIPHDVSMAMATNSQSSAGGGAAGTVINNYYTIDAKGSNISRAEFMQILDERDRVNAANAPDLLYDARYRGNQKVAS